MMMNPEYRRIYNALRRAIEAGEYPIGTRLPPEPQLEKIYGVSRTTVRKAISMLAAEKLVSVRQGYGTEVLSTRPQMDEPNSGLIHGVPAITERVFGNASGGRMRIITSSIDTTPVYGDIAAALDLPNGSTAVRLHRVRAFGDQEPFSYKVNYLRPDMVPGIEKHNGKIRDLYALLKEEYGLTFHEGDETVTAVAADFLDAQVLQVSVGAPLIKLTRYAKTESGPLECAVTKLRPEFYEMRIHMEGPPPSRHKRFETQENQDEK